MKDMLVQLSIALGLTACFGMVAYLIVKTQPIGVTRAVQAQPDTTPDRIREGVWECMALDGKEWKLQDPAQCPPITK